MKNVSEFIKWGLTHVKKASVPKDAILPIDISKVGSDGEWEYLYGTTGEKVTQSLIDSKYSSYYKPNGWSRSDYNKATEGWVKDGKIVCDCQGVEDNFSKSQTNADGNYRNFCTQKGLCKDIKRAYILGEALFNGSDSKKTHVGWVCGFLPNGDVLVMEERGLSYGFVITQMSKRSWKYRGLMTKRYEYSVVVLRPVPPTDPGEFIFHRVLKYGCVGPDVMEMKKALAAKGFGSLIPTNPNFFTDTQKVIREFQAANKLIVDGIVGANTYKALGVIFKKG